MLNKSEKEQIIRILKRIATSKKREIEEKAIKIADRKTREINKLSQTKQKLKRLSDLKKEKEKLNKEIDKTEKEIKKYAEKFDASFRDDYLEVTIRADSYTIEHKLKEKLNKKLEEMTLKILCADCDKKVMGLIEEFKKFKV